MFQRWHYAPSRHTAWQHRFVLVRSSKHAREPEDESGDSAVQDSLVNMLKLEIGKKQVGFAAA